MINKKKLKALSSVEIILSLALFFVLVLGLSSAIFYGLNVRKQIGEDTKANYLLDEGIEALFAIKDSSYASLVDGTWGLVQSGGTWTLGGTQDVADGYVRQISISNVDDNTKLVEVNINWTNSNGLAKSISSQFQMTNYERVITTVIPSDWSSPLLAYGYDMAGSFAGLRVKVYGNLAYILQTSGSNDFTLLDTTDLASLSVLSSFKTDSSGQLYDITYRNQYVYASSSSNGKEFQSIDVTDPIYPNKSVSLNLTGNANALGVVADPAGNYVYMTRASSGSASDPEFHVISLDNPAVPVETGSLNLGTSINVNDVAINADSTYAYVATSANNAELMIVNITNKSAPTFVTGLDLSGNTDGARIIYYNGTVYLARTGGVINVINVNNPNSPALITTYNAGGEVGDMALGYPNFPYLFLATANSTKEFQIVDISNVATPTLYGSYNATSTLVGVDYEVNRDIAIAIGNNSSQELVIFSGRSL
jgi:hypothetical protein